jgi:hypothetical protein
LTLTQKYTFDAISSILGRDMARNIFIMITFADCHYPFMMEEIKAHYVLPHEDWFKFNNSAIFNGKNSDKHLFSEVFWDLGCESFDGFFSHLNTVKPTNLTLTKEVLQERKKLEVLLGGILPQINLVLRKINVLEKEESNLRQKQAEMNANKNYTYSLEVPDIKRVDLPHGVYSLTCLRCNFTCQNNCAHGNDDEFRAMVMRGDRYSAVCTVCPGNCSWKDHKSNPYKIEYSTKVETRTYTDLLRRYKIALSDKNAIEKVIQSLNDDLRESIEDFYQVIRKVQKCVHRLDVIALKCNPLTEQYYVELLIESEKQEAKRGWEDRIKFLEEAKALVKIISGLRDILDADISIRTWAKQVVSKLRTENNHGDKERPFERESYF